MITNYKIAGFSFTNRFAGFIRFPWNKQLAAILLLIFLMALSSSSQAFSFSGFKQPAATAGEKFIKHQLLSPPAKVYASKEIYLMQSGDLNPGIVLPKKDGTLRLTAEKGKGIGPKIEYMPEWKAYGWFTAQDQVEWLVKGKKGLYDVYLEWSVSDKEAGKPFVFQVGDQVITGTVATTGSWEVFKTEKIGTIRLQPGRKKVVFNPGSNFDTGALLDLREIKLVPVK